MNETPADPPSAQEVPSSGPPETATSKPSRAIRRVHMYTALFLGPWLAMYALSTLVMAHRGFVSSLYSTPRPAMVVERELDYSRAFPTNLTREEISERILEDLGLEGTRSVSGGQKGQPLVINRQQALTPRRITFDPGKGKLQIEREEFRAASFLERMHRRRGYNEHLAQNLWGFVVDAAVAAMVFWSLSGVWLWWELRSTRLWGALALSAGTTLFVLFAIFI